MRMTVPLTRVVRDEQTGAELAYAGGSADRDMLGSIYRMTMPRDGGNTCVEAIAGDITYVPADKYAKSAGINVSQMSVSDRIEFVQRYASEHGAMFDISKFEVGDECLKYHEAILLRDQFLRLFFERQSSYRYNRQGAGDVSGYYPDQVQFYPYNVDRKICGVFCKADV